ncbi:MepB protein [Leptospira wolbachii serovar Codice str. CDC]|uniref:MepB protein n=1 Tax=Leptospira wolbachii serovar Codice str. CDC TaxID=1218599 RepID=R9A605_9LEPT|nr:MepB family protein [Leptospira wolbachii]EOQ97537.1 MepB protein [Leptospira wolbachii serovar Codice str. CDC]
MPRNTTNMKPLPPFLMNIKESLFDLLGLVITNIQLEPESAEYDACYFQTQKQNIRFRKAKITPTKVGQFVTLWKRSKAGPIEPFNIKDDIDIYIIATNNKNRMGNFLFTKQILNEKGILSGKQEGKRGFRVYPSWDKPNNKQGLTTQNWQLPYFVEYKENKYDLEVPSKLLDVSLK